jgi:cytochrome c oxidase assembly protein subunit 15
VLTGPAPGSAPTGAPAPTPPAGPGPAPGLDHAVRRLASVVLAPSPVTMRRIALAGVLASAGIILTGAAVRLSQSGLGCPDWPNCTAHSVIASGGAGTTDSSLVHRWIEFTNRSLTGVILVVVVAVAVAAWRFRPPGGGGRQRDLVRLALVQPAGIIAQAVFGGIVVLTDLDPVWVSVHFLLSITLLALAVALYARTAAIAAAPAPPEPREPPEPPARRDLRILSVALVAVVSVMLAAGTVVTGTGPLAGGRLPDGHLVPRYHLPLAGVTQLHADIGWLLTGITVALLAGLHFTGAPRRARRLGWAVAGLILAQGAVGYTQYFTGLPAGLVWVHVTGAVLIWITALRLMFALHDKGPVAASSGAVKPAAEG